MNGPEAAMKMRDELKYSGKIIGTYTELLNHNLHITKFLSSCIRLSMVVPPGVTGNALPEEITRFVSHGANEVLTKPLTRAKLLDAVSRNMI